MADVGEQTGFQLIRALGPRLCFQRLGVQFGILHDDAELIRQCLQANQLVARMQRRLIAVKIENAAQSVAGLNR